ncbi:MAG: TonB-dependent receptor domain-containing protein, partial [Vulcanimicrobiaceae bacterium]
AQNYSSYCPAYTAAAGAAFHSLIPVLYNFQCGDQREQVDKRFIMGFNASRSFETPATVTTIGIGVRNDNIAENGLFLVKQRVRFPNGVLSDDHILETETNIYVDSQLHLGPKLRLIPGLRFDNFNFTVGAPDPANSGKASESVLLPKFVAAYAASPHSEFYADFGESFHSNDARGVLTVNDPQTHRPFDPTGAPVVSNSPVTHATGEEIGYRYSTAKLTTTIAVYSLYLANELVFDGDHGTTSIGGPDQRNGIELTNFYRARPWLTFDGDFATARARFLDDPLHQGLYVPESLNAVISLGATVDKPFYAASLRLRYFGPRVLDQAGDAYSGPSTLLNGQFTAKLSNRTRLTFDVFNILNASSADVTYFYSSWLPQDATPANLADPTVNPALGGGGVNDYHFHPSEKRTLRLTLSTQL